MFFRMYVKKTGISILLFSISITLNIVLGSIVLLQYTSTATSDKTHLSLVATPIQLSGTKVFSEKNIAVDPEIISSYDSLSLTYNLHGLCALPGEASSVFFQDIYGKTFFISLSQYGKRCFNGDQSVSIPLSDFGNLSNQIIELHVKFWYPTAYTVDITDITLSKRAVLGAKIRRKQKPLPTPKPTTIPTPIMSTVSISSPSAINRHQDWAIQSVSSMKETKDKICNQDSPAFIQQWVANAKELGANYIAVETPYDNPTCNSSVAYTKAWIDAIRSQGLHVWHRHMPLSFEGIYNTPKDSSKNYIQQISDYIKANASFFKPGDIFTPIPEPQNGGIAGVTYCANNVCIFASAKAFNQWLRDAMSTAAQAFQSIGLGGQINIGYYGFDGFVAWGDNNPEWHGILEDTSVQQMGNITIDHYPEAVGETMQAGLDQLQAKYPNTPIVIGEWGTITCGNVQQQVLDSMGAAKRKNVIGFNYWHMGMGGCESLLNDDFTHSIQYDEVQSFFTGLR